MSKAKKILCLFDYGKDCYTGFATVSKNIKREIKKYFGDDIQLDICSINHYGDAYTEDDGTFVFSAKLNDFKEDDFGRFLFLKILNESNEYDGIFVCQDIGIIQPIIEILESIRNEKRDNNKKVFKSIFYFPVDCKMIYKLVEGVEFFDVLVTYTEYGRNEVLRLRPELKGKVKVVPHGNNSKEFYPLSKEDRLTFRKEFFGENADKFIITNVNRNQPRKDIPSTIFGFLEAKRNWKEHNLPSAPFLYLHCHPKDPLGWDIRAIFHQIPELVEERDYKLLPIEFEHSMVTTEMVNKIYNASDVYLTTTLGEGWGLGFSEAASCKIPIIAPYTTSFKEMSGYGKWAYMLETIYPYCNNRDNTIREQVDIYEVSDLILLVAKATLTSDADDDLGLKDSLNDRVEKAYKWVNSLEWVNVCKQWIDYFKKVY